MEKTKETWLKLIFMMDKGNHVVKEGFISEENKIDFYSLKDDFLNRLIKNTPPFISLSLKYIPYYKYSNQTKDKAGDLMRSDYNKKPFEYYLGLVEPSVYDIEIKEKATIEVIVTIENMEFSFHIPYQKTTGWNISIDDIPQKTWISNKEFKKDALEVLKTEIVSLMKEL